MMTTRLSLRSGVFGAAVVAVLAALAVFAVVQRVQAQGAPPPLPGLFLGAVEEGQGPEEGHAITAMVENDGHWANCGFNYLKEDDEGNLVYDVDVNAREALQSPGCGVEGSRVRFYFPQTKQYAEQEGEWSSVVGGFTELDLTIGAPLSHVNFIPNAASDRPLN